MKLSYKSTRIVVKFSIKRSLIPKTSRNLHSSYAVLKPSFNNQHKLVLIFITALVLSACKKNTSQASADALEEKIVQPIPEIKYGYDYNLYEAKEFKIKRGDTFGAILEQNGIDYPEVYTILQVIKKSEVNIRKLKIGKPYTLLFTKDSVPKAHAFIYHPGVESYDVIQLKDSLYAKKVKNLFV